MNIGESISSYERYLLTERRLAQGTVKNYMTDLESLNAWLQECGVDEVEAISARDIRSWQMAVMEAGIGEGTVKRKLSSVRSWFRYMRRNRWIDRDVMAKITAPKSPKHLPVFFKESETERIYDAAMFANDYEGERDKLILRLLYETGMRRSELAGLRPWNIDLNARQIKVLGKGRKERYIPIEAELKNNIEQYLTLKEKEFPETDSMFVTKRGRPFNAADIYRVVKRYMSMISSAEKISPHVFRHTFATHLLNDGANIDAIKELLGHANLNATEIYTHNSREHLKEAYKHAHPRAGKK